MQNINTINNPTMVIAPYTILIDFSEANTVSDEIVNPIIQFVLGILAYPNTKSSPLKSQINTPESVDII